MSTLRTSLSSALAASLLLASAGCQDSPDRHSSSITAPESPVASQAAKPKAPARPLNFRSTGNTSWSVSLAWDAVSGAASYRIRDQYAREISVPGSQTSVTWKYPHPPLQAGSAYTFTACAVNSAGARSPNSNAVTVSLPPDNTPPTVPAFTVTALGMGYITLAWSSSDDSPFISYQVTKDGEPIRNGGLTWVSETSRTFTQLQPGTTYTFTAQARDSYVNVSTGNLSAVSAPFTVTTRTNDGSDVTPPTQPSNVQAFGYGDLEMQVWWGASTDAVTPQNVIVYEIYVNGVHENTAVGTNMTPSAYGVAGNNVVTVVAIDEAGNRSTAGSTSIVLP